MAIIYDPSKLLKKIAPPKKIERLVTSKAGLKKSALSFVSDIDFLNKKSVSEVALKTVKGYQARIKGAGVQGAREIRNEIVDNPVQLIQRVQNEVLLQVTDRIKQVYNGEKYEWLPSDADEPDPEHQLNYGKIFTIGEGEQPGDRIGCKCGMRILVKEEQLEL